MKKLLLFLCFLTSYYSYSQSTWEYYGSDRSVQDIQVVDDKVWIGNTTGLHILDIETGKGELLQSVNSPLRGNFIKEILPAEGHVWIALEEGGIARYDKDLVTGEGSWTQFYTPIQGDHDTLYRAQNLMEDKNGTLWFDGSFDGIASLFAFKDEVLYDYSDFVAEQPFRMTSHGIRNIYFRIEDNSLYYFDVDTEITHSIELPSNSGTVYSFVAYKDALYVCFEKGDQSIIYRYDGSWHLIGETDELLYLTNNNVAKGAERMWFSNHTSDNPYYLAFDGNQMEYFSYEDLVGSQVEQGIRTIIINEDVEGRIWFNSLSDFGGGDGVYSIDDNILKPYDIHHSSLLHNSYERQDFDCDGNLLLPFLTQFQVFDPDTLILHNILPNRYLGDLEYAAHNPINCKYYVARDGFSNNPSMLYEFEDHNLIDSIYITDGGVSDLHISSDGTIYAALAFDGVGIYDKITKTWDIISGPFDNPAFNWNHIIWSIREGKNGIMTFGTSGSLVVYDGITWTTFDVSNSPLGSSSIHEHFVDSKGNILVSYNGGIYKYDGEEWEFIAFYDPNEDFISAIQEDDYGNFWLGTYGSGLLYWNGFDYQEFNIMNSALPSNKISDIMIHPITGDLWLSTTRGLIVFDPESTELNNGLFGKAYYDADQDMNFDPGVDVGLKGTKVSLDNDILVITDQNGNYAFYPEDLKSYNINCTAPGEYIHTTTNELDTLFNGEDIVDLNFGLWKEIEDVPLTVDVSVSPFLCSSEISTWITLENPGFKRVDGQVLLEMPEDINIISTFPEAEIISTNAVRWDFTNLSFQEQRTLYAVIEAPTVEEVFMQVDSLSEAIIPINVSVDVDGKVQNYNIEEQFLCSYDPNDKLSRSSGEMKGELSLMEDELEFTIRFQNEGNYKADKVVLVDTLDDQLDTESLRVISSSHPVYTQLNKSNELVFRFLDIDLPPKSEDEAGSQGFVKYSIKAKEEISDYTLILNTAQIYFDNNAPISTNTTKNILVEKFPITHTQDEQKDLNLFEVYPNPTNRQFFIKPHFDGRYSVEIRSSSGQVLKSKFDQTGTTDFSIEVSGLYFIYIKQGNGSSIKKIIVH